MQTRSEITALLSNRKYADVFFSKMDNNYTYVTYLDVSFLQNSNSNNIHYLKKYLFVYELMIYLNIQHNAHVHSIL